MDDLKVQTWWDFLRSSVRIECDSSRIVAQQISMSVRSNAEEGEFEEVVLDIKVKEEGLTMETSA